MKEETIITFESEDSKIKDCVIYSDNVPDRKDVITQEELEQSGLKKILKLKLTGKYIPEKIGKRYSVRITTEQLKMLFDF